MQKPPFPAGDSPDISEVADWVECCVLAGGTPFKRGDLKSALDDLVPNKAALIEEAVWTELKNRHRIFGENWPLRLRGNRLFPGESEPETTLIYSYLALLGMGLAETQDRVLFEELIYGIVKQYFGGAALRIGHPARQGMNKSFRLRVTNYARASHLNALEVGEPPFSPDKDLGVDVVAWAGSVDGRGGDLHFLFQCATGLDWPDKLDDINLSKWADHLRWALPPVRALCFPGVISVDGARWIRYSRQAGMLLDRPRITEMAKNSPIGIELLTKLKDRLLLLSAE